MLPHQSIMVVFELRLIYFIKWIYIYGFKFYLLFLYKMLNFQFLYRYEATVRIRHRTTDWFKIGAGVHQGCILSPCLSNLHAEHIMQKARLEEAQAGIKIAGRNINNLRHRWHHPYARKQRRTKEPLDKGERREWKSWLKTQHSKNEDHGIWSHHCMTNRWGKSDRLYLLGLQNQLSTAT